ncbi:MAG: CDP-diacylglycerol--serine O-phosphatidyltransferase [Kiritimatiellia bacterium]
MKITWKLLVPTLFTILAFIAGFFAILAVFEHDFLKAAKLVMLSMILDGVDGNIARLLKSSSPFGAEMDTYVDILSFGVAPALMAYFSVLHEFGAFGLMITTAMVLSGMLRLARFKVVDPNRGQNGFLGLPITVNAGLLSAVYYIVESREVVGLEFLREGWGGMLVWSCSLLMILLQVSHVRYPKPSKNWVFFVPSAGLVCTLFIGGLPGLIGACMMVAYGLYYAFLCPLLPREAAALPLIEDEEPIAPEDDEEEVHASSSRR